MPPFAAGDDSTVFEEIPLLEGQLSSPFAYTHLASEAVAKGICERAMLVRSFYEVVQLRTTAASVRDDMGLPMADLWHRQDIRRGADAT